MDRCCTVEVPQTPRSADVVALGSKTKTNSKKPKELHYNDYPLFVEFWNKYPQKRDKRAALTAWLAAVEAGAEPQAVIAGAKRYAAFCRTYRIEPQHIKYAQGWLSHERWNDEEHLPPAVGETDPAFTVGTPEYAERVKREEDAAIAGLAEDA